MVEGCRRRTVGGRKETGALDLKFRGMRQKSVGCIRNFALESQSSDDMVAMSLLTKGKSFTYR